MIRVMIVGLGPIGLACARAVAVERELVLTGLVDIDPQKRGKTLSQIGERSGENISSIATGRPDPVVTDSIAEAARAGADVAVVCTSSALEVVAPTLRELMRHRIAVVSSCERMAWPWYRYAELGAELDREAQSAGRAMLGTGVNPGFVMDSLAVVLGCVLRRVTGVRCERRVDAGLRRQPLQAKVGATMKVEKFNELKALGKIGHEGLPESIAMIAAGMGRRCEPGSIVTELEPVIAARPMQSALGLIQTGQVAGIHNTGKWEGDGLTIDLDLTMAVGCTEPRDRVTLEGPVQLRLEIPGGTPGDSATVAALLNHIPVVHDAKPGLRTMLDVRPAGCRGR